MNMFLISVFLYFLYQMALNAFKVSVYSNKQLKYKKVISA